MPIFVDFLNLINYSLAHMRKLKELIKRILRSSSRLALA